MKFASKLVLLAFSAMIMTVFFQNCGRFQSEGFNEGSSESAPLGDVSFKSINDQILVPKCVRCHNATTALGNVDYSTWTRTLATASVVPGQPAFSAMYTTSVDGSMPQGDAHLTGLELRKMAAWIEAGALGNPPPVVNAGSDTVVTYAGTTTFVALHGTGSSSANTIASKLWSKVSGPGTASFSSPTAYETQVTGLVVGSHVYQLDVVDSEGLVANDQVTVNVVNGVSFASLQTTIFTPKCTTCHNPTLLRGNYDMTTYANLKTRVVVGDALGSKLYQRCANDTMPSGVGATPLTPAQKTNLRNWINQGALNN